MKYSKPLLTIQQQIDILKQRGLLIEDDAEANKIFDTISYFRLAGYWRLMEADKQSHTFKSGSRLSQIVSLYHFDEELRLLVFSAIQHIEVVVRARMIRLFSERHGAFWFMDSALAESNAMFSNNLRNLQEELNRSEDEFILEHFSKYDEPSMPPVWKTLEVSSMGTLSKLYSNMGDSAAKKAVSRSFMIPKFEYMRSWLRCITVIRNISAHHARLWNTNFVVSPNLPKHLPNKWITNLQVAPDKLYPHLCYIAYWHQAITLQNTFTESIKSLLSKYPVADPAAMGFPRGWQDEPLWQ
ncbi:MAG: Abi family protein [Bacteroidales bacterium]|nr:Abi family protein [Bacteroidales bacterium]